MWVLVITYLTLIGGPIDDNYLFKSELDCLIEEDGIELAFAEEYGMVKGIDYVARCEPSGDGLY